MTPHPDLPLFVSIPHSGEQVPDEVSWLKNLKEETLMRDVDRFVDRLYDRAINDLALSAIITPWHRYVVDLNRHTDQFDATAVEGAPGEAGTQPKGLHWSRTTFDEVLIESPMSEELHHSLVKKYYEPFHNNVQEMRKALKDRWGASYQLDLHSMPSQGTSFHPDPGQTRAEIVVSDFHGKSCKSKFKDLVMKAYQEVGFQVAYNWPYVGGGITQMYGDPNNDFHTLQIEMNRALYMDEKTKKLDDVRLLEIQKKLTQALSVIKAEVRDWVDD